MTRSGILAALLLCALPAAGDVYKDKDGKDVITYAASVRPNMEAAKKAGFRFVYREIAGMGHSVYVDPPLEDGIQWLKAVRNKEVPLEAADQAFLDKLSDASKLGEASTWLKVTNIG